MRVEWKLQLWLPSLHSAFSWTNDIFHLASNRGSGSAEWLSNRKCRRRGKVLLFAVIARTNSLGWTFFYKRSCLWPWPEFQENIQMRKIERKKTPTHGIPVRGEEEFFATVILFSDSSGHSSPLEKVSPLSASRWIHLWELNAATHTGPGTNNTTCYHTIFY